MITESKKKKKEKNHSLYFSIILGVLVTVIIGFLVFSNIKMSQKKAVLTERYAFLQEQLRLLEQRKKDLEAGISYQGTEEYLEGIAKDKLNLRYEGEQVVSVVKNDEEDKTKEEENFLTKFLNKMRFW